MKNLSFFCLLIVSLVITRSQLKATTLIVNNNNNPAVGEFTTFSDAHTAAAAGDTIYVVPSVTSYGSQTISKSLVVFGIGFNPSSHQKLTSTFTNIILADNTDNTLLSGLHVTQQIEINTVATSTLSLVEIEGCFVGRRILLSDNVGLLSSAIRGCILGSDIGTLAQPTIDLNMGSHSGLTIQGNVIYGNTDNITIGAITTNNATIENNIFVGAVGDAQHIAFGVLTNCTINNNIFYGTSPSSGSASFTNNAFGGNITFSTLYDFTSTAEVIPGPAGTGPSQNSQSTNVNNSDPLFENLPLSDNWSNDYDPKLRAGSPGLLQTPFAGVYTGSVEFFIPSGSKLPFIAADTIDVQIYIADSLDAKLEIVSADNSDISDLEYFFDGNDPGLGMATIVPVSDVSPAFFSTIIPATSLTPGIHTLHMRVRDDAILAWSIPQTYTFLVSERTMTPNNISKIEYFFDDDLGYDNGTIIAISPGPSVVTSLALPSGALSTGIHNLHFRAQLDNGLWGMTESRLVYVDPSGLAANIETLEYFVDDDPGYGSAIPIDISAVPDSSNFSLVDVIPTGSLGVGFHNLNMRAQLVGGAWGLPESRLVYASESAVITEIQNLEYFFDDDPGYGNGTSIDLSAVVDSSAFSIATAAATGSLNVGFHTLFVRAELVGGSWGVPESRVVYMDESAVISEIQNLEYFFDNDPGYGNATSIDLSAVVDSSAFSIFEIATTAGLNVGFHNMHIRAEQKGGSWGIIESRLLYVDPAGETSIITKVEYFFDNDPGNGNGAVMNMSAVVDSSAFSLNEMVATTGLNPGFHNLYVRAERQAGNWGIVESRPFYVDPTGVVQNIDQVEFFFDNDPGYGSGILIDVPIVSNSVMFDSILTYDQIPQNVGSRVLYARPKTIDGVWGIVDTVNFEMLADIVPPTANIDTVISMDTSPTLTGTVDDALATISVTVNGETHSAINNGDGTWSLAGGTISTLPEGSYNVQVVATDVTSNVADTAFQNALVVDVSPVVITLSNITTIVGNRPDIQGSVDDGNASVTVTLGPDVVSATVNNDGNWFVPIDSFPVQNTIGTFNFDVDVIDLAGNPSTVSADLVVIVSGNLMTDSLALVQIRTATNGDNWTDQWLPDVSIRDWPRVTIENDRVTILSLASNNLSGNFPTLGPSDLNQLKSLGLRGNNLTSIPDLTVLDSLKSLTVQENALDFDDLLPNISIPTFLYADQQVIGASIDREAKIDSTFTLEVVGVGSVNSYQWTKNSNVLNAATNSTYSFVTDSNAGGAYNCRLQNDLLPGLTLVYNAGTVIPVVSLSGTITSEGDQNTIEGAQVFLLSKGPSIKGFGFDTVQIVTTSGSGNYMFEKVRLGNYLIATLADTAIYMGTYQGNVIQFANATTIIATENLTGLNITALKRPVEVLSGDNRISGFLEENIPDNPSARILARRRVRLAGVSLYRSKSKLRKSVVDPGEWDLIGYTQTDDQGNFSFGKLPDAFYLIQIEFPGVPLDDNATIEFDLRNESVEQQGIELAAVIEDGVIKVEQTNITGLRIDYFKNLVLFPVPSQDYLFVSYDKLLNKDVIAILSDASGNTLSKIELKRGNNMQYKVDMRGLTQGLYIIRFVDEGFIIDSIKVPKN